MSCWHFTIAFFHHLMYKGISLFFERMEYERENISYITMVQPLEES